MQIKLHGDEWEQARKHRRAEFWRGVAGAALGASAALGLGLGALWRLW